jgi:hypothetical protein
VCSSDLLAWLDADCAAVTLDLALAGDDGSSAATTVELYPGDLVPLTELGPFAPSTTYTLTTTWDTWTEVRTFTTTDGATPLPALQPVLADLGQEYGTASVTVQTDPEGAGQSWWRLVGSGEASGVDEAGVADTTVPWLPNFDGEACYHLDQVWLDGSVGGSTEDCHDVVTAYPEDGGVEDTGQVLEDCVGLLCGPCGCASAGSGGPVVLIGALLPLLRRRSARRS